MNLGDVIGFISSPFDAAAGWAWDTVIGGITNWLAKGFVQLVSFVWMVMDQSSSPRLTSDWFAGSPGAPYVTAVGVAGGVLGICVMCALINGIIAGRPLELVRRMFRDTPVAVGGILFTVAFAQVAIELCDAIANGIWEATRPSALTAVDGLLLVSQKIQPGSFLGPLLLLVGMIGMLLLWAVLLVRESLIYLVVALCPLAWAASVWPALAGVRRRLLELLAGLIVSKVAIAMALAVGLGALGGAGSPGEPGNGTLDSDLAQFGTLVTGVVVFGLAAFMPFLVLKLVPIVEAAAIAQTVPSAPIRAGMQAMQYSYYLQGVHRRLASGSVSAVGIGAGGASGGSDGDEGAAPMPAGGRRVDLAGSDGGGE